MLESAKDGARPARNAAPGAAKRSMNVWRRALKRLFADSVFESLTPDQNLAVLEALEVSVLADGEVTEEELRLLRSDVWRLPWAWNQEDADVEQSLEAAARRIDAIRSDEDALLEHTEAIAARLPDGPVREAVYEMLVELSLADGAGEWEDDVLEVFRRKSGIPRERAQRIAAKLKDRIHFG
ncbi:MAG: TerB family tellurite resistance protein [Candidatus Wallbacteria bacterium]|nr:TerB family tellurite resistance protein [Candidatus Wallbacteria bacterium]